VAGLLSAGACGGTTATHDDGFQDGGIPDRQDVPDTSGPDAAELPDRFSEEAGGNQDAGENQDASTDGGAGLCACDDLGYLGPGHEGLACYCEAMDWDECGTRTFSDVLAASRCDNPSADWYTLVGGLGAECQGNFWISHVVPDLDFLTYFYDRTTGALVGGSHSLDVAEYCNWGSTHVSGGDLSRPTGTCQTCLLCGTPETETYPACDFGG
jgi:hypothetical protein